MYRRSAYLRCLTMKFIEENLLQRLIKQSVLSS